MRHIFIIISFLLIGTLSFAQKGKIEGKVSDAKTGQPLIGVSVINSATKKGSATDVEGRYSIVTEGVQKVSLIFTYNGVTQQIDEAHLLCGSPALSGRK